MTAAPISITGPASLVEAVPYLLGFTPAVNLVLVGLRERHLSVTARLDLYTLTNQQITDVLHVLATEGCSNAAVAITYSQQADPSPVAAAAAATIGVTITAHLRVHDGRYWCLTSPTEGCCPAEGTRPSATQRLGLHHSGASARRPPPALGQHQRRISSCG